MRNQTSKFLINLAFTLFYKYYGFGLKSIMNSLSITPDLSPGLLSGHLDRALAHNSFYS